MRGTVVAVVAALATAALVPSGASARPWLSKHDARHALHWYAEGDRYAVKLAARQTHTHVYFRVRFYGTDVGFTLDGSPLPATFTEDVDVRLRRGHIWVEPLDLQGARWR